ncbi:TPA: hypothetical protein H1005_00560 [archaeon]|uniref:Ribonuclease P protein component 3 n=1 Tax=Candidatus Naiadarchaeum limnaeum TaxID=2756139 RepID=A0A832URL7_9ARCH|nr:hypothetical protein [Candidatus Naiadarchaeales archaeon SRR2090153.bin1042]HIK00332.1 hypothetical protein [Candidatus Naiadarchaeum limnaeum]
MYDLHNFILTRKEEHAQYFQQFGIRGISVIFENNFDVRKFHELKERYQNLDLISVVEVVAERKGEVKKAIDKFRNQVDLIIVNARDTRAMRAAAEFSPIDFIAHAFVDQTAARDCAVNNVALEFDVADFLGVYGMKRATLISKLQFNLDLARKYKIPIILASGAQNVYGLRNATQIIAFAETLGFKHDEAKAAVLRNPFELVKRNRERRKGIEIAEGVKIVRE